MLELSHTYFRKVAKKFEDFESFTATLGANGQEEVTQQKHLFWFVSCSDLGDCSRLLTHLNDIVVSTEISQRVWEDIQGDLQRLLAEKSNFIATAMHCNSYALQQLCTATAMHCNSYALQQLCTATAMHCNSYALQQLCTATAMHCNSYALQQLCTATAMHCNSYALQQLCTATAMHCNSYALQQLCTAPAMHRASAFLFLRKTELK